MALREYSGTAKTTSLAGTISASALSINLADASGYPTGAVGPFVVTVDVGLANEEKVLCSSRTGNTLSVATGGRGFDGTTASDHDNSATVQHTFSAVDAREANAHVNDATGDPHPQYLSVGEGGVSKAGGDTITASAAGVIPLVVKGAAGQTANLLQARDSADALLLQVGGGGGLTVRDFVLAERITTANATTPANVRLTVRGAASQTANLAEFQADGGSVLTLVRPGGQLLITPTATAASSALQVSGGAANAVKIEVRGSASQSANLAEFQNSAGTVLAGVTAAGGLDLPASANTEAFRFPAFGSGAGLVNANSTGAYAGRVAVSMNGVRYWLQVFN